MKHKSIKQLKNDLLMEDNKNIEINWRNINSKVDLSNTINAQENKKFTKIIELSCHNNSNIKNKIKN